MHENHRPPHRASGEPERPRTEPEIIPPGRADARAGWDGPQVFVHVDRGGSTHRVDVKTPGPFAIILVLLAAGLFAAVILALVLGALFFLIPIAAVALAALIAYAYAHGFWRRLRGR